MNQATQRKTATLQQPVATDLRPYFHPLVVPAITLVEREQLILGHLAQVRLIARRIHDRLPESVSLDDLVSTGVVGLINAIDRFDAAQGVKLKTYAEYKIRGAILDSLRGLDWAPRQQRKHRQVVRRRNPLRVALTQPVQDRRKEPSHRPSTSIP